MGIKSAFIFSLLVSPFTLALKPCGLTLTAIVDKSQNRVHLMDVETQKLTHSFSGVDRFIGLINPTGKEILAVEKFKDKNDNDTLRFTHLKSGATRDIRIPWLPKYQSEEAQRFKEYTRFSQPSEFVNRFFIADTYVDIYHDGIHTMVLSQKYDDKIVINKN